MAFVIVAIAAFFNAIMDSIENENFFKTVFRTLNQHFWYKRESWKTVKFLPGTKYRPDGWHQSKSAMLAAFLIAGTFYDEYFEIFFQPYVKYYIFCGKTVWVLLAGTEYILIFNLFYNKIFRSEKLEMFIVNVKKRVFKIF